ncbi:MAG: ATP-binding cassette domain-containing protein [Planctomycetota bacterium]
MNAVQDALVLSEITKSFGDFTAVDRFSLNVPTGQVLGFLGPNGAGKTTTLRMVMGITYPDSGSIQILGHPVATEIKDRVGYLPEERGMYRKLTAEATLRYFGKLKGLRGAALSRRITESLERVGLQDWGKRKVEALSKGMQQKLQFVCTLLHEPELVILDEPFSGLDPLNVDLLERLLADLRRGGATVIFSTHQMEQAERLCDRIVLINRGRKLIDGPLTEVRARFDTRMLVLEGEGDYSGLSNWDGVINSQVTAGRARLELAEGVAVEPMLHAAVNTLKLTRFELQRPSLQEIFVKLVEQDRQGAEPDASASRAEVSHE